jgi:hypothetical protein
LAFITCGLAVALTSAILLILGELYRSPAIALGQVFNSDNISFFAIWFLISLAFTLVGGLLFGLPLLYVGRHFGWMKNRRHFMLVAAIAGSLWLMIIMSFNGGRSDLFVAFAIAGALGGVISAEIWWRIVERTRINGFGNSE